ncbi:bifunctional farnesyl-diphosphate farnesyltransferase/squalene synthase [Actinomortierella ambigua]|uniref:squalene synthase n=1 Tax=Actinomortierella ambigua TaxID=1343610 RepID=A0A9P6QHW5_9FUNG|nr:bifunctional farnesyl-diphosphate farnesyltransferase/squalene synthase [Actinomortierella ambigua]
MASVILASLFHPSEVVALLQYKFSPKVKYDYSNDKVRERIYYHLNNTSRSFSAVIQALDPELKDPICIFYLVLRGLDTVEDDMTIDLDIKLPLLKSFHEIIYQPGWTFDKCGPKEKDRQLLVEFDIVIETFLKLKPEYQKIIADTTKRMGEGMAHYATAGVHVNTTEDFDQYCHYVAGLVGLGLSGMFSACNFESPSVAKREDLSNSMGLFLQKVNITRDFLEDLRDNRHFWPKAIWGEYADKMEDLAKPENKEKAMECMSHMVHNALCHMQDVLEYLGQIKNPSVFHFCAIPQVMAIATLNMLQGNYNIFTTENVKIRKGETVWLMKESNNIDQVAAIFRLYARQINNKTNPLHRQFVDIGVLCGQIEQTCVQKYPGSTKELARLQAGVLAGQGKTVAVAAGVLGGAYAVKKYIL